MSPNLRNRIDISSAVYHPTAKHGKNEEDSAVLFKEFAEETRLNSKTGEKVEKMILATIKHLLPEGHEDDVAMKLFLDLDLEILGSDEQTYRVYTEDVRREYGHLSEGEWLAGRSVVMKTFLERERLYFSEAGARWEERARRYVEEELERLGKELDGYHSTLEDAREQI